MCTKYAGPPCDSAAPSPIVPKPFWNCTAAHSQINNTANSRSMRGERSSGTIVFTGRSGYTK
jgi:hypothetical protein